MSQLEEAIGTFKLRIFTLTIFSYFTPFNEQGPAFWQVFVCVSIILIRYRNISGRVIKDDCSGFTTL